MSKNTQPHTSIDHPKLLLEVIASKWTIPVIYTLCRDTKRYNEIHKAVPGTTQKVLTSTLRKLQRNGVITRTVHPTSPPQVEYCLTELGLELLQVIEHMAQWAQQNHTKIRRAQKAYDNQKIA
jgi:DNA-binding HxlR family transcriptional regulator